MADPSTYVDQKLERYAGERYHALQQVRETHLPKRQRRLASKKDWRSPRWRMRVMASLAVPASGVHSLGEPVSWKLAPNPCLTRLAIDDMTCRRELVAHAE